MLRGVRKIRRKIGKKRKKRKRKTRLRSRKKCEKNKRAQGRGQLACTPAKLLARMRALAIPFYFPSLPYARTHSSPMSSPLGLPSTDNSVFSSRVAVSSPSLTAPRHQIHNQPLDLFAPTTNTVPPPDIDLVALMEPPVPRRLPMSTVSPLSPS